MIERSNASVLGPMFEHAYVALRAKDGASLDGLPPVDVSKLARSTRTKSGFVGVYANGKGFRAMARDENDANIQKSIGTFASAEQAAWARYLHYTKHKLPYGEVEALLEHDGEVDYYREYLRKALGREPTPQELLTEYNQALVDTGREPIERLP